ncbi:CHAT domain-containing protein [Spongiibacter sp. KMU-158]|uniref:CHAT domain-containing protein n=1 Tax=Spongiibacter pelagi TaxID=2760804 RepID=A0A927GVR1_9GAMM|nr:CHAT domain-containing protein [Spongiibacter pelagi]MBD2858152.1 CHAT domain-containing protein [Spongiibacter pelagi]
MRKFGLIFSLFLTGCVSFDISGKWAAENALKGNYKIDYTQHHPYEIQELCTNLLKVQNFKGFDYCISQLEKHHVVDGRLVNKLARDTAYMSEDYTTALIYGLKAEAALNRGQAKLVPLFLSKALIGVNGNPGMLVNGEVYKNDRYYPASVSIRTLGVGAVYEGVYGSKDKAHDYLKQLQNLDISGLASSSLEPEKRAWLTKIFISIKKYELAYNEITQEKSVGDKLKHEAILKLNPAYYLVSAATGWSYDDQEVWSKIEADAMLCHTLYKLEAESASVCYESFLQSPIIDIYGALKFTALKELGNIQLAQGAEDKALASLSEAVELLEEQRSSLSLDTSKLGFVTDKQSVYRDIVDIYVRKNRPDRAIEYAERGKARALVDLLASRETLSPSNNSSELQTLIASLDEAETRFSSANISKDTQRAATRGLLRKYKDQMNSQAPEFTSLRVVTSPSITQLQDQLAKDEGLLEYFGTEDDLWVFILSKQGVSAAKLPQTHLKSLVTNMRHDLQNPSSNAFEKSSKDLYKGLITPIEDNIAAFKRITIVPHGSLHYVPFSALYNGDSYLIDKFELRVLPSASVLPFLSNSSEETAQSMLLLGNPDLNNADMDLPGAEIEALAIAKMNPDSKVLLRKNASEHLVKTNAGGYRYIHIASHGVFDPDDPMSSSLLLSEGGGDDGLLSVAELFDLRLNADLVTLSACETGLGDITAGDDVIGFTRGFLYAGAESIISSLWKVSDAATNTLMQTFYKALPSQGKSKALRNAQLALKDGSYSHPYYWAAFQLTGQYD